MGSAASVFGLRGNVPNCEGFVFDERGNITRRVERSTTWPGVETFRYDALGRVVEYRKDEPTMCEEGGGEESVPMHWTACGPPDGRPDHVAAVVWRTDGRLTSATVSSASNPSWRRVLVWDARGRLRSREEDGARIRYEYADDILPIREERGDIVITYRYDERGRVVERAQTRRGEPQRRSTWTYDEHGHPTLMRVWIGGVESPRHGRQWTWEHDQRGLPVRVTELSGDGSTTVVEREYDERGQIVSMTLPSMGRASIVRTPSGAISSRHGINYDCLAPLWEID